MEQGLFVLENRKGQVVRTFQWDNQTLYLVYRQDTRRVEPYATLAALKAADVPHTVILKTTKAEIKRSPVDIEGVGQLRFTEKIENVSPTYSLPEESEEPFKKIFKWTTITHVAVLALIFISAQLVQYFTEEERVVEVFKQVEIKKVRPKAPTVTASAKKVKPQKVAAKVKPKVKKKPKKTTSRRKYARKNRRATKSHTKGTNVNKTGVLGVLGGHNKKANGPGGLKLNGKKTARGGSGVSGKGGGGLEKALHGKGLVQAPVGTGGKARGGGSYGTRGKGGGSAGYGTMKMAGSANAYSQPLGEEAFVEGGLGRDQIAAVINRHLGEVTYCYEKGLQTKPDLSGRVAVRFVIASNGRVSSASIAHSSLRSNQVEGCIVNRLRGWKFPKPVGGVNVKVTYPFVLRRVSQG